METAARLNLGESLGARVLKVDHAGEHGAVNIYRGQHLACRWRSAELRRELMDFQYHEERHRAVFAGELQRRGVRRCRSYHLCGVGGFILRFVTDLPRFIFALALLYSSIATSADVPTLRGRVNDYAGLLQPDVRERVETSLARYESGS